MDRIHSLRSFAMTMPPSRRLDFSEVPVIDIGPLVTGDEARLPGVIEALRQACTDVGFMYVKNHGVPRPLLDRLVEETRRFFALPHDVKMTAAVENSPQFRGFLPVKYKGATATGTNLQEGFIIMHERPLSPACPSHGPNQWPAGQPGFKAAMQAYFAMLEELARRMLPGLALALGRERDFFAPMFTEPMMMLKLNHYPPQDAPQHKDEIGVVSHTDSGAFTILWQDDVGGLEILNKSGEWVVVPPIEDTYVINIGDMTQIWSNGAFSSTPHRVINRYGQDRYSIPFFVNPNYDTLIRPLIGTPPADFKPFVSGKYQRDVYAAIYPQRG